MIRRAQHLDIDDLILLAKEYYENSEYHIESGIDFDYESAKRFITMVVKRHAVFVAVVNDVIVGAVGGAIAPWVVNLGATAAQENIAWARSNDADYVAALRGAYDAWARSRGAKAVIISCFAKSSGSRIRRL